MIYGYARVSTDGQSLGSQVRQLETAGCDKVFSEKASGAKADGRQLQRLSSVVQPWDVVVVTRLDRLARSTRDLLNFLGAMAEKKVGFSRLRISGQTQRARMAA
jgi:DNA invertase Pin-like site-specific DNA recombinase